MQTNTHQSGADRSGTIGIKGHTFVKRPGRCCAEVWPFVIKTPKVTLLVTVGVAGNKKNGVERSIADQQLIRVTAIHGSKAFPQSIGFSFLPIFTSGSDG